MTKETEEVVQDREGASAGSRNATLRAADRSPTPIGMEFSRRSFLKGVVAAAGVGALASSAAASLLSLLPELKSIKVKEAPFIFDTTHYPDKGGREVSVSDFNEAGQGFAVRWNGQPAVLIKLDEAKLKKAPGVEGVEQNILACWATCPHACCVPNWRISKPEVKDLIWCICHDSRYDPHDIVEDKFAGGKYFGARWVGGPALRALPMIPIKIVDGKVIGLATKNRWYNYCSKVVERGEEV